MNGCSLAIQWVRYGSWWVASAELLQFRAIRHSPNQRNNGSNGRDPAGIIEVCPPQLPLRHRMWCVLPCGWWIISISIHDTLNQCFLTVSLYVLGWLDRCLCVWDGSARVQEDPTMDWLFVTSVQSSWIRKRPWVLTNNQPIQRKSMEL